MRFLIRANIPTEDGNKMVQDPKFLEKLEKYINKIKAEATYFFHADGNRVEFHPVMSLDDLKKGIPQAVLEANSYRY